MAGKTPGLIAERGAGNAPTDLLFVQRDGTLGPMPGNSVTPQLGMLPTTYNVDSFAYRRELLSEVGQTSAKAGAGFSTNVGMDAPPSASTRPAARSNLHWPRGRRGLSIFKIQAT